jgi:L-asparaginase II
MAFRSLAMAQGRVWTAMTSYPELVGGDDRLNTKLMRRLDGAMAKDGAEGVFAIGFPDGRAAALKIADGQERSVAVVLASALGHVGVEVDGAALNPPVLGHGRPVGAIRSVI